ncbi:MAG: tetratricopeptide repeat protein, partial [Actinomycetota bacterium]|nr:tetratricopeptide repeat protein [Actinomycetota bacterium]
QGVWFDRLETEHDNIRITLEWTIEHDPVSGHRLGGALWQFWKRRGYLSEGRSWLTRVLAANTQVPCRERAAALLAAGDLSRRLSDFEVAETLLEECVALYAAIGDELGRVRAMHFLALTRQDCGKGDRGHALYMEALASARLLDARPEMAETLNSLGSLALDNADMEAAEAYYQEALGLYRETGNKAGQAAVLNNLGEVATAQGNHAQATSLLTESLARYREVGELTGIASTLHSLGVLAISQRRFGQAATHLAESLLRFQRLGDVSRIERCVWSLAGLAVARGDAVRGVRLYAAQRAARERLGDLPSLPIDQDTYDRDLATARAALGARAFALAWTQGRAMAMEEAISYAVESATDVPNLASGSAASASHGLTPREREVLLLLAAGRSDREIAEVLFISPGTATTHVKHVLQKLGVPSRAAAAAEAVRRNLA